MRDWVNSYKELKENTGKYSNVRIRKKWALNSFRVEKEEREKKIKIM